MTKEEVKVIMRKFSNKKIKPTNKEYKIVMDLLMNHPSAEDKIGIGVDYFFVQHLFWNKDSYMFIIHRKDGSIDDFSYLKCLSKNKDKPKKENWNAIFRGVIKNQIDSFKMAAYKEVGIESGFICSHTNLKYSKFHAHIDHVYPLTFDSILNEFITINKINLTDIELKHYKDEQPKILNKEIFYAFQEFHKERAVLRIVSNSVNLKGSNTKDYNGKDPLIIKKQLTEKYPQYHLLHLDKKADERLYLMYINNLY